MYPNLLAELKRANKRYGDISKLLNIGISTVNEKMAKKSDFKISELKIIKKEWFPNCSLDYLSMTKYEVEEKNKEE